MKNPIRGIMLCLLLLIVVKTVLAQVSMALQLPPTGVMQKNQLWNMVLASTSNETTSIRIKLTILNKQDNTPVMTAYTRTVLLNKGVKLLSNNDFSPIQYDYQSPIFNVDRNPNGFLPIGNFIICYSLTKIVGDAISELTEECLPLEVTPLSAPQLQIPADNDTVATVYPAFNWLPPAPVHLFSDMSYHLTLVEINKGQTAMQAIQQNVPIYTANRLQSNFHQYPANNKALDTAKTYAWRIAVNNNGQLVSQTEVWTFCIGKNTYKQNNQTGGSYWVINESENSIHTIPNQILQIKYVSPFPMYSGIIFFSDEHQKELLRVAKNIQTGDNYFEFQLPKQFIPGKLYQMILPLPEQKFKEIRFTILKNQ